MKTVIEQIFEIILKTLVIGCLVISLFWMLGDLLPTRRDTFILNVTDGDLKDKE